MRKLFVVVSHYTSKDVCYAVLLQESLTDRLRLRVKPSLCAQLLLFARPLPLLTSKTLIFVLAYECLSSLLPIKLSVP